MDRVTVHAKKIIDSIQPERGHNQLWLGVAFVMLLALGGFFISMRRHDLHEVHVKAYTAPVVNNNYRYPLQIWPVKPPYVNTYSASNLQAVETEMLEQLDLIPKDTRPPCLHASSLGVAVDTMIVEVDDKRYIVRDILSVEGMGERWSSYHRSPIDAKQMMFRKLYHDVILRFVSSIQVGTMVKQQRAALEKPLVINDRELAHCIQLYYSIQ